MSSLLSDANIKEINKTHPFITPFIENQVREENGNKVISYGLSSFGYDIRCGNNFMLFSKKPGEVIDPKNFSKGLIDEYVVMDGDPFILPPHTFALTYSQETLNMPVDVMAICIGKSTYARTGLIVNVTPIEPAWRGQITIEISNTTDLPIYVYPNEGIAQLVFFRGDVPVITYNDRDGKYQDQVNITLPKI